MIATVTDRHVDFANLKFGSPAAERDINEGLDDYFVESQAFNRIEQGDRTILLGNRGMGKSAIFKVLAHRRRAAGDVVIELAPEDYSYEILSQTMAAESEGSWAKLGAYSVAWKYLIYVLVMKEAAAKAPNFKRGDWRVIYNYLRDNHPDQSDNPIGTLISYVKRMEGVKIGQYEAAVKTRELQHLYKLEELSEVIPALNRVTKERPVYVFVDELDRGWDASEDAQAFVAGLFQAGAAINGQDSGVRVYMSLRQELYDSIPNLYEDAQKYRDLIEEISWSEDALKELMAKRIRYSVSALAATTDESAWGAVFAETLQYRQNKSFNYMVDRTLNRPREIIGFASSVVDLVERRDPASFPIDYATISEAERAYSRSRAQDLSAEYRFQYPGLLSVFDAFRGRVYTMDRDELEEICLGLAVGDIVVDGPAKTWCDSADPEKLIEILWRVGFLRARTVGGVKGARRSGSSYVGSHHVPHLNLANIVTFQVHPMFRAHLGLREPKKS